MSTVNLSADIIDVRDIIERVEELEDICCIDEETPSENVGDELEELETLKSILEDLKGNGGDEKWNGDWYPLTLIADSYFEETMDELLEDIGVLTKDLPSYLKVTVDYDALQMDYASTEIDGVTYWYR
jgi:hypothetical protein